MASATRIKGRSIQQDRIILLIKPGDSRFKFLDIALGLIDQFSQQNPDVKAAIALALGKLRDARALPMLLSAVSDDDEIVRANALYALSSFYTPNVVDTLINSLDDPVQRVREAAGEALTQLTGLKLGPNKQAWLSWWQQQKQAMTKDSKS